MFAQPKTSFSNLTLQIYFVESPRDNEIGIRDSFGNLNYYPNNRFYYLDIKYNIGQTLKCLKPIENFLQGGFYTIIGLEIDRDFNVHIKLENSGKRYLFPQELVKEYFCAIV